MMNTKDLVSRFYGEVATDGNFAALDEIVSDDFVLHGGPRGDEAGTAPVVANLRALHAAFEGLTFEVHDVLADGDRMAARWTLRGRHTGDFNGRPASGAAIEQRGTVFYRVADGRIAEQWVLVDVFGMISQIEAAAA
jgi:steroid delta-isomerase-like uncharacterized protein